MNTESQKKTATTDPNLIGVIEPDKSNFTHTHSKVSLQGASLGYGNKNSNTNDEQEFSFDHPIGKHSVVMVISMEMIRFSGLRLGTAHLNTWILSLSP